MEPKCVLIVDDDPLVSGALKIHLEESGFQVVVAESCAEGRRQLMAETPVDLIILDHMLPDGRGTDLLSDISKDARLQDPPVVMSSSLVNPSDPMWQELVKRLPVGARDLIKAYMQKPYTFDNMDTVLQLVFHTEAPQAPSRFVLGGDYRHPLRRT
jgi:DNA-binding response OmpR family regulator